MRSSIRLALLLASASLGSCVPAPAPEPAPPPPVPVPAPTPAPAPPPPRPVAADWRDWPVTPGTWTYRQDDRGSIALFGRTGTDAELTIRCDRDAARIFVSRRGGAGPAQLSFRTSSTLRTLAMRPTGGTPPYLAAELAPRDALLDAIGYSRGKFVVEGGGLPPLVLPAWAEVLRVAEDCRG